MLATGQKFVAENDVAIGLYFDFGPMLYMQTAYTMTKFCVQHKVAKAIHQNLGTSSTEMSKDAVLVVSPVSGIATDVAAPAACPDSEISFESNLNDLVTGQDTFVFHLCPIRILKRMLSNTTITRDHEKSVFPVVVPPVTCQVFRRIQITLPYKWQLRTAHQSNKYFECGDFTTEVENDYIFEFATEVNEETTTEKDDVLEEYCMMIYVKIINGKTISVKCEGKQKAAIISDEVERRSLIPRDMTYLVHNGKVMNEQKTIEENNIEAGRKQRKKKEVGGKERRKDDETKRRHGVLEKRYNGSTQKIKRKNGKPLKKG